jgi:Divergent InlB B-repeat domain
LRLIAIVLATCALGVSAAPAMAADGTGTMGVTPSTVIEGSTDNYVTFTYTAAAGGVNDGSLALLVPSGWTTPSTSGGAAGGLGGTCGAANGYTTSSAIGGTEVATTGVTLDSGRQCTIEYGIVGSDPGDTAPSTPGTSTFTAQEASSSSGSLTDIASSPAVEVSSDGTGTMTMSPTSTVASSTGNTLTFTYTAGAAVTSGEVTIALPSGWSTPSTSPSAPGDTTTDCPSATVQTSGSTIEITGLTMLDHASCTITYGDQSGGGPGATAPTDGGYTPSTFQVDEMSSAMGTLTPLASGSPEMTVTAADGSGTMEVTPQSVITGSSGDDLTFVFLAPSGGIDDGNLALVVPTGWTAPNANVSQPGGLSGSCGDIGGYTVTPVTGGEEIKTANIYLLGGQECTIEYGVSGSDSGVTAPTQTGPYTFTALESSTASGTLTGIQGSPIVDVGSGGAGTMTVSPEHAVAGSSGNTLTFTYTATKPLSGGELAIAVPSGWSAPSSAMTDAGATTTTCPDASVGVDNSTIDVTGIDLSSGSCTVTYGDQSEGGPGATAPSSGGGDAPYTFSTEESSNSSDTLTTLGSGSPQVTVTAGDGAGTMTVSPSAAISSSTGNQLTFDYTAPSGGLDNGSVSIAVPVGWSPPQTTASSTDGYVSSNCGSARSVSGSTISVGNVTLDGGTGCTIVYGSGGGASAPAASGPSTFTTEETSTPTGTPTGLSVQPVVIVGTDGTGALALSPSAVGPGTTGNTLTFTYQASVAVNDGELTIQVPSGFSAPSTSSSDAGYTTTDCAGASVVVTGLTIEIESLTLDPDASCTVTYGDRSEGGSGASAAALSGAVTFPTQEMSSATGTLTELAASPPLNMLAADGSGQLAVAPGFAAPGSSGNTFVFTYMAGEGGLSEGRVSVAVPSTFSAPSTTDTAAGYTTTDCAGASVQVSGLTIELSGVTLTGGDTCTITYGDTSGSGPGVTVPTAPGNYAYATDDASTSNATPVPIQSSPSVSIPPADGVGTLSVSPASVLASSRGDTLVFTYTPVAGGIDDGELQVAVPAGWSPPSTFDGAAGAVTSTCGTVRVTSADIDVTGVTLAGGSHCTITYGSTVAGGPGASAPPSSGAETFPSAEMSTADGTLTALASWPTVDVEPLVQLTVNVSGGGSVTGQGVSCSGTCSASYAPGTKVALTATPSAGQKLSAWGGACTGAGACAVTLSGTETVSATFVSLGAPRKGGGGIRCVVPKLKGDSRAKAERLLRAAHCAIGKVTQPKARKHHKLGKLVVTSTSPGAGAKRASDTRIGFKLGPAPKPKARHHRSRAVRPALRAAVPPARG